ncbi:MAG: phytanoyl-CoA dioxygenase family protein [Okeania sp. SIO2F4]|uniref:phytanoyl-CoA dioxygenase family protein n=1 Tax=Okeania sp. SIO2F4 TaxID=2607790 RepID=UPI00142BDF3F|nr:phytanoyl-CoA dioxygenase family protein [Okeania sp. SIO2F4]NES06920.1 phytanoyl-CoA dioxygenase family protein [Okeania sp. SIO2F4]
MVSPIDNQATIGVNTIRPLSKEQIAQYHEDGFVIVPRFFSFEEIEPVQRACNNNVSLGGEIVQYLDKNGNANKLTYWTELGDSLLGIIPRLARMVDAVEILMGSKRAYHFYSKIVKKEAHSQARIEWHSGYGSWYSMDCLFPYFVSSFIAIDQNTKKNGCIQVLKKSHLLGRIDHVLIGEGLFCESKRIEKIEEKLELVSCEMEPGDILFMDANTIHRSLENNSDDVRHNLVSHYNAVENQPVSEATQQIYPYQPLIKLHDSAILNNLDKSVFLNQKFIKHDDVFKTVIHGEI